MPLDLTRCTVDDDFIVRPKPPTADIPDDVFVSDFLFRALDRNLDRLVFVDHPTGRTWNAGQVKEMSLKIASALKSIGMSQGKHICGYMPNTDIHAICQFGIYAAADVYVGCYWTNPYRELLHYVKTSDACAIFCCEDNFGVAKKVADEVDQIECLVIADYGKTTSLTQTSRGKKVYSLMRLIEKLPKNEILTEPIPITGDPKVTPIAILFSSGSTGEPKGVIRTHYNGVAYMVLKDCGAAGQNIATFSGHQPLPHISGNLTVLMCAINCACVFNEGFNAELFLESVERYKVNVAFCAPSAAVEILRSGLIGKYDTSSLIAVWVGGAPMPDSLKKPFAEALGLKYIKQAFAATESGGVSVCPMDINNPDTIGVLNQNVEIKIVDRVSGAALGPNQVGEAYIRGPEVSIGYYKNPKATEENFTGGGFLKTGDAMYYDEEGLLYVVDRYKEVMYVDTKQVMPSELESVLLELTFVKEAAVVGIDDEDHGQVPKAFVVVDDTVKANEAVTRPLYSKYSQPA